MGQTAIDGVEGLQETGELDGLHDLRQLMWGHSLLLVCAVLYLIWWCIFCGCCGDACIDRKYGQSSLRTSLIQKNAGDYPGSRKSRIAAD